MLHCDLLNGISELALKWQPALKAGAPGVLQLQRERETARTSEEQSRANFYAPFISLSINMTIETR